MSTVIDLRGRHFLTLDDYTPEEIRYLLELSAELKAAKKEGREEQKLVGKEIALIFEKDSTRTRCAFEVAAFDQGAHVTYLGPGGLAHGPQGVGQGHGARARPDVRRDRVPRLLRADRERARRVVGRAGLQRADRRLAPDADPGRLPDLPGALPEAARRGRVLLPRRRPLQHGEQLPDRRREARHGRPDRGAEVALALGRVRRPRAARSPPRRAPRSRSPTTSPRRSAAATSCSPTSGSRWASRRRSGRSGSSCCCPTR